MLSAFLVRFIPANRRVLTFTAGMLACLPAVVLMSVRLALAMDATQATAAALMCGSAALGSLTHGSILMAVTSSQRGWFWVADALAIASFPIGFGGIALGALS